VAGPGGDFENIKTAQLNRIKQQRSQAHWPLAGVGSPVAIAVSGPQLRENTAFLSRLPDR
jgi:hypothetical protein